MSSLPHRPLPDSAQGPASPSRPRALSRRVAPSCSGPSHPLTRYGWDADAADAFSPYAEEGGRPARVVRVDRGRCDVATAEGVVRADTAPVAAADPERALCTGDWVVLEAEGRGEGALPQVRAVLPRRTAFVRGTSTARSEGQVLAANVDRALIAVSLATEPEPAGIERFTALAWANGIRPLIVLTKADLATGGPADAARLTADVEASAPGAPVLAVSAATGLGLDALASALAAGTSVLLGRSGAGKSTLANALLGEEIQEVRATRERDGKGRHTTTTRDLLPLPAAAGGVLIDTPGLRGVGLWDAADGIAGAFPEIEALVPGCRFHDCRHEAEPGCAVLAAVEDGTLPGRRLESYRRLQRENARLAARTDARLRAEQKRTYKQRSALGRHMAERKRGPRRGS